MALTAVQIPGHGREPEIVEHDEPRAGDGESLIRLRAAGLNPVDLAIASGRFYMPVPAPPYIAGAEAVGEIVASARYAPGTRVWCHARTGCFAEMFVVADDALVPVPDAPTDGQAVAAGIAGLAGWLGTVARGECAEGERVLVLGAHGVAGRVAIAAARSRDAARIVGVVRRPAQERAVLEAGADTCVTSEPEHLEERIEEAMEGATDLAVDMLWGIPGRAAVRSLGMHGRLVQVGNAAGAAVELPAGPFRARRLDLRGFSVFNESPEDVAAGYEELCGRIAGGGVALRIEVVPLGEAPAAWRRQQAGTEGAKLVLVP